MHLPRPSGHTFAILLGSRSVEEHAVSKGLLSLASLSYNMDGILNVSMSPELALYILVAEHAHLSREVLAMSSEETSVQQYGREQCHWGKS